jgi:hypothetical protein
MAPETEAPLPDFSLGIVSNATHDEACLCTLDLARRTFATCMVPATGLPIRQEALDAGRCDAVDRDTLKAMAHFFDGVAPPHTAATVLVESERILPHPDHAGTPAGVFTWTSAALAALISLIKLDVPVALGCYEVPDRETIVTHHIGNVDGVDASRERPKVLSRGLLRACAQLLLGNEPNDRQSAAVAALLARAPGAYYYWSTFGEPPSLGDVVHHRRQKQSRMLVASPTETFSMYLGQGAAAVDEIALAYALSAKAHDALGPNDASKTALLSVCKEFDFSMRCTSKRRDAVRVDPRRAWPWPDDDAWAIEAIQAL